MKNTSKNDDEKYEPLKVILYNDRGNEVASFVFKRFFGNVIINEMDMKGCDVTDITVDKEYNPIYHIHLDIPTETVQALSDETLLEEISKRMKKGCD